MSEKKDLLGYCNEHGMPPRQFMQTFCQRCRNTECVNASWGTSVWQNRMRNQKEILLDNPQFADLRDPKFQRIHTNDFPSLLEKAVQLEIADRRGDWEIPEVAITDNKLERAQGSTTDAVDEAVKALAKAQGKVEPDLPDRQMAEKEEFIEETHQMMQEDQEMPPGFHPESEGAEENDPNVVKTGEEKSPPTTATPTPRKFSNTEIPNEGIVIGGGEIPKKKEAAPKADPWAVPKDKPEVVKVGAKIRMGLKGLDDDGKD